MFIFNLKIHSIKIILLPVYYIITFASKCIIRLSIIRLSKYLK